MKTAPDPTTDETSTNQLCVETGCVSIAGCKKVNEDAVGIHNPDHQHVLESKGIGLVIADGVSSAEAGKEASEYAVTTFLKDYFLTPDTWSVKKAGQKALTSINLNLYKKSHAFTHQEKGFLCTFSGIVIKSRTAHFFHAGDSRVYLLRDGDLKQLTRDHTVNIGGGKNILARAVGMDNVLQVDYGTSPLKAGDAFLLTTDGVHDFIGHDEISKVLNSDSSPQVKCSQLVEFAQQNGSDDNISCALAQIIHLPGESREDLNNKLTRLPFPPAMEPGMKLDGYKIEERLFASSRSQLYLVTDLENNNKIVMKTPSLNFQDDVNYIDRFIQEEWIGKRINSPHVVRIIEQNRPRTCLYYLMEFVPGISLEKWMEKNPLPKPKVAIGLVKQIADALRAFHQSETIHQDLKPGNIIVDDKQHVTVIDFGSVFVAGIAEIFKPLEHQGALGTASYSDPHYLLGRNTSIQGDIYSLATISYELFTGNLPYGEKIDSCQTELDFDKLRYHHAVEYNPVIPLWFDRTLEKGVSLDLDKRYGSLPAFIHDLTHPNPEFLRDDPGLDNSRGLIFWQFLCAFWIITLVIVIILFSMET